MNEGFYWKLAFQNLRKNRQVYLPYLLSSVGILIMYYTLASLGPSIDEKEMFGGATVATILNLGRSVIGIFAVLFLFYTNSFMMKRRKKELGLYNILGMEKRHVAKILRRETVLVSLLSIALGLGLGILFSKAMFLLLGKMLGTDIPIAFTIPLTAVSRTAVLFAAIFFAAMLYNILQIRLSKPIELLHGGEVGEKEPRAHWILAVLGFLFLGAGYWLALSITSPIDALTWFFVAVILVIAGTYLLFITGITALLKLLKKNKGFYYRPNHFTTVSGMLYRMKQNAAGLASICILFTCLLVTVSATFSLYTGMEGIIRTRYPRNILISVSPSDDGLKRQISDSVQETLSEQGAAEENAIERENWTVVFARNGENLSSKEEMSFTYCVAEIYTQEEFCRFSGQSLSLKDGEILMGDPMSDFPDSKEIVINGASFSLTKTDYDFAQGYPLNTVYETYFFVVPGTGFFQTIGEDSVSGSPTYNYNFDVDGDDQAVLNVASALRQKRKILCEENDLDSISFNIEDSVSSRHDFYVLYGGLFFVGLFLGVLFLLGTALIIYYKQVSEGYEDAKRFTIMQQVGMSRAEVKKSIHSQILTVFFLPLLTSVLHLSFAFPMLQKILLLLQMGDFWRMFLSTLGCVLVFSLAYAAVYGITAQTYYKIVEKSSRERGDQ